jgi:cellulose synthase/poly-beta-1,6-N-acetylglucosamine synthase-like glycosyltransferase
MNVDVTVGFCVKDVESTLKDALDSIYSQDYPHSQIEIIAVVGFSRDRTLSITQNALDQGDITSSLFNENKGLGPARQLVVEKSVGKYILWVDGDMVLPKTYVRKQVEFMESHPKVGLAGGKYSVRMGEGMAADLENVVYVVDSIYGERGASKYGYLPGTEGAVFRVEATRQIGGFDLRMNGAAEDTELAFRMKAAGWDLAVTKEVFSESTRPSWVSLWKQYLWYGKGGHFIFHKNRGMISLLKMTPMSGFVAGVLRVPTAYLLVHRKSVFLLPFHYTFKRVAWCLGFFTAHRTGYGHDLLN